MSDQPQFALSVTRSQIVSALLDLDSDFDRDSMDFGFAADMLLHRLDPTQFPVHPADAPPAIAAGPTTFTAAYPGSPQYYRTDAPGYVLLHDRQKDIVKVLLPTDRPSGSLHKRTVGHTVAIIDDDLADAIAAASAAVDHMMGRGR